jgi:tRNA1(Val) A37 N6-methylase TrmN6
MGADAMETSEDAVLGGRLVLRQPLRGHRVGHDAILLGASTAAHPGEHAVEFGAGVGAAGLALALRVSGLKLTLVEIDADLAALTRGNAVRNDLAERVRVIIGDAERLDASMTKTADRVLMNPPFNDPRRHNVSPDPKRRRAHVADVGLLQRWTGSAARVLRDKGVLTLIWRADDLDGVLAALRPAFGNVGVQWVLPRADTKPVRVLVRAVKGADWMRRDCTALVLNDAAGKPTREAEAVLREAATLALADLG